MDLLQDTTVQPSGAIDVQIVDSAYATELTNVVRATLALGDQESVGRGQAAWFDDKVNSLRFLADVVGLEVSPEVNQIRTRIISRAD